MIKRPASSTILPRKFFKGTANISINQFASTQACILIGTRLSPDFFYDNTTTMLLFYDKRRKTKAYANHTLVDLISSMGCIKVWTQHNKSPKYNKTLKRQYSSGSNFSLCFCFFFWVRTCLCFFDFEQVKETRQYSNSLLGPLNFPPKLL